MSIKKKEGDFDKWLLSLAQEVEARALAWVAARRNYFNPLAQADLQRFKMAIKAASELALVCSLACTNQRRQPSPAYRELTAYLWDEVFRDEALQEFLLNNTAGLPSFSLYASLRQCGYEDANYRARLEELLADGYISAVENIPSVQLDFLYNLKMTGLTWEGLSAEAWYQQSFLARHPNLYSMTNADAYTITHTLFFLTNFGRTQATCFSAADQAYLRMALPRLLEFYLRRGDWDLTAELLSNLRSLDIAAGAAYRQGWAFLLSAQNQDGSFNGPDTDEVEGYGEIPSEPAGVASRSAANDEWILFRNNYHTTLAVLLAIETALRI